jgi:hypothetical protein
VNSALTIDLPLSVGEQSQHVSVNAAALQVETVNTQLGDVVTGSSITAVPLERAQLHRSAGATAGSSAVCQHLCRGHGQLFRKRESGNGEWVHSQRRECEGRRADGYRHSSEPGFDRRVPRHYSNFDPEYGNYSGGMVNVVTKSGSNQYHGSAFDFLRNTDLNARNFFSPGVSKYIQNQFGGTAGGPIFKDKLFLLSVQTRQVPDPTGDRVVIRSSRDLPVKQGPSTSNLE